MHNAVDKMADAAHKVGGKAKEVVHNAAEKTAEAGKNAANFVSDKAHDAKVALTPDAYACPSEPETAAHNVKKPMAGAYDHEKEAASNQPTKASQTKVLPLCICCLRSFCCLWPWRVYLLCVCFQPQSCVKRIQASSLPKSSPTVNSPRFLLSPFPFLNESHAHTQAQ
jgi:hypothetical protein